MTLPSPSSAEAHDPTAPVRSLSRAAAHVLGIGLVTAALIALPTGPSDLDRHQLPKEMVVHLAVWLAVVLARPARPAGISRAMVWSCLMLVAWSMAASVTALNPWLALRATALTATGVMAFITARHLAAMGHATLLLGWAAAAAAIGAGTGLAQAFGFTSPFFARARAPGGTFGNRNFLAHFSAIALPVVGTLVLTARRTPGAVLAACATIAPAMMIVLSRSRAAWLGSLVAGTVVVGVVLLQRRTNGAIPWTRIALVASGLVIAAALTFTLPNTLQWRTDSPYTDTLGDLANASEGSGRGRILQYRNTTRLALRHPYLGVGPGNWPLRYGDVAPGNDPSWSHRDVIPLNPWPSSDWMALASERGLLALLWVVGLGIAIAWRGVRGLRAGDERALGGAGVLAIVAVVSVQGGFDAVMLLPAPLLLAAVATGALLERADGATPLSRERLTAAVPKWWWLVPAMLAFGVLRSVEQNLAYVVAGSGAQISRLRWAGRIDPWSYPIRIALATREPCVRARDDAAAVLRLAPTWPAARTAARRCGVVSR
ncbi:MAG: O-antigen ligase family protein [Gemmatimonadales bacterium]|nr:O-antigen ligase family protein [Gemmatimonadales bacterium]